MKINKYFLLIILLIISSHTAFAIETGHKAPSFNIRQVDGQEFNLSDYKDNMPVYLVFWATWCPGCKKEIPFLNSTYNNLNQQIKILAINVGVNDSLRKVKKYIKKYDLNYSVAYDKNSSITRQYNVSGVPAHIVIDRQGMIRYSSAAHPENLEAVFE
ncbi:MAG: TlpA family protein disulfide reductase [bacterium]|nr:TlpA family protein disulfide reductase [bacterium]